MILKEESSSKDGERKIIQELLRQRQTGCQGGGEKGKRKLSMISSSPSPLE